MGKYPTDEELELFIRQLEQQELYAPKHLKEQILSQAFPKQTVEVQPKSGSSAGAVRLLAYRLKIVAGMAAALLMLLLLPSIRMSSEYRMDQEEMKWQMDVEEMQEEEQDSVDVNYVLNKGARQVNQKFNDWFGRIGDWQFKNLFDKNGGNEYEN